MTETLKIVVPRGFSGRMADDTAFEGLIRDVALYYATDPFDGIDDPQKYGICWNDDRFWMTFDCQCSDETCWFCGFDCGCEKGKCRYFIDGVEVDGETSWQRNYEFLGKLPHELYEHDTPEYEAYSHQWKARVKERDRRWVTLHPAITHTCVWQNILENRVEGADWRPRQQPPNFCLKKTGLKVWWYKFIGRDMEFNRAPTLDDVKAIEELEKMAEFRKRLENEE